MTKIRISDFDSRKGVDVSLPESLAISERQSASILRRLGGAIGDDLMSGRYGAWRMIDGRTERIGMYRMRNGGIYFHFGE